MTKPMRVGGTAAFFRDVSHLAPDQVEGNQDAPDLLDHAGRRATADRLFTLQQVRLDFVVAELGFPSLVVEADEF